LPLLRRHWGLAALLVAASVLRVLAVVAIRPGTFFSDSNVYVESAATGVLSTIRPVGYSLLVAPFYWLGSATALIVVQHLIGLGIVAGLYALLIRRGAPRWLAVLGAAPAGLDLYLVVVEHVMMAETVFHAALLGTFALVLWRPEPSMRALVAAGALLGYVGLVRSVGVAMFVVFVVYLLARGVGWRRVALFVAAGAVVTLSYMTVFAIQHGRFATAATGGQFLYGKIAPFADCDRLSGLGEGQRALCPDPGDRLTPNEYTWSTRSPIHGREGEKRVRSFALRVVRQQFGDYLATVTGGFVHYFRPGHEIGDDDYPIEPWQFPEDPRVYEYPYYRGPIRPGEPSRRADHPITEPNRYVAHMADPIGFDAGVSRRLHWLQLHVYTPGPLFALCVLLVLAALVLRRGEARLRADAALVAGSALVALAVSQALSVFSYRYGLGLIVFLPFAAALAATSLGSRRAGKPSDAAGTTG
jgi:hypothetical protein